MGHIAALTLSHITTHSITAAVLYQCGGGMVSGHGPVGRVRCRVPALQRVSSGVVRLGHDWVASARARTQCSVQGWAIPSLGCMSTWPLVTGHRALPPHWTWQIIQRVVKRFHSCGTMCPDQGTMHGSVNYLYLDCNQIKIHEDKVVSYGHCCDMWVV